LSMCARGCRSDPRTPLRHVLRQRHPGRSVLRRAFESGDQTRHVGEYRIETLVRALRALQACGYDDVEVGSIERDGKMHLLLIGLDGEARFGDWQMGCIAVAPVGVD